MNGTPWFARKQAQAKLDDAVISVEARNGVITENDMYEIIKLTTPKLFLQQGIKVLDGYKTCVPLAITASATVKSKTSTMEKGQHRQISIGMNKQQQNTHNTTKQIDEDEDDIINPNVEHYDTKYSTLRTEKARRLMAYRNSFIGGIFSLLELFLTIIILCGTVLLLCVMINSPRRLFFFVMGYCDP